MNDRISPAIHVRGAPDSFRRRCQTNIYSSLLRRQISPQVKCTQEIQRWAETQSLIHREESYCRLPNGTKSTISITFSPDGSRFASTHGDHTIKIIEFASGEILQTLVGHPRTPWTVKYHPCDSNIIASGCLGFQVRVWNISLGICVHVLECKHPIISLAFHSSGTILGIASGTDLITWTYGTTHEPVIAYSSHRTLRCLHFLNHSSGLIIGEANDDPQNQDSHRGGEITVSLRLFDVDLYWLRSSTSTSPAVSNPRLINDQCLLYNDGGLDISACEQYLAVCVQVSTDRPLVRMNHDRLAQQVGAGSSSSRTFTNPPDIIRRNASTDVRNTSQEGSPPWIALLSLVQVQKPQRSSLLRTDTSYLGEMLQVYPLPDTQAGGVTSVKFSPTSAYVLLGYGVRERQRRRGSLTGEHHHRAVSIHRWQDLELISGLTSALDDVNVAMFHPTPGAGFCYGTRQGRICFSRTCRSSLSESETSNDHLRRHVRARVCLPTLRDTDVEIINRPHSARAS